MATEQETTLAERPAERLVGRSVERLEDERILSGNSQYVDDIDRAGMLHARIYRSDYAHATLVDVDVDDVWEMPGVVDVLTGADAREHANAYGGRRSGMMADHPPLADGKVRLVGEGVVAVAAETHYQAEDALEAVSVDYDPLTPVLSIDDALDADADAIVHPELDETGDADGNVWGHCSVDVGDVDAAFEEAAHVVSQTVQTSRPTALPMETHAAVADYDPGDGKLTLHTSTQEAHQVRRDLADALEMPVNKVRVAQPPNVGGGFGHKLELHENEIVAAILAIRNERPVKVVLDRPEEFQITRARQPQRHDVSLALDEDGRFLAIRDEILAEAGAYAALTKPGLWLSCHTMALPYWIENVRTSGRAVFTNTVPSGAYRGFGMTQAITVRETLIDTAAAELGIDRWELRRRNMISDDDCPTTHPMGFHLDSYGTDQCLGLVRESIDDSLLDADLPDHVVRGLGLSAGMHVSSIQRPAYTSDNSSATLRIDEDGSVTLLSDQCPMGTGIQTALAQIVADELGVAPRDVDCQFGDSEAAPFGLGSWGSRGIVTGGTAAYEAACALRERLVRIAAYQLGVEPDAVAVGDREFYAADPDETIPLADLCYDAHYNGRNLPDGMTAGNLVVTRSFDSPAPGPLEGDRIDLSTNYPSNAHACVVEVDTRTGLVEVLDYAVADDVGRVVNPMLVEGQVQGGTVQGIGMALGEHLRYDENGQLLNGTMEDYRLPLINETPMITKIDEADTTSTRSPLGTKGVGESGAILGPVTVLSAVNDALADRLDEPTTEIPLTPETVWRLCGGAA